MDDYLLGSNVDFKFTTRRFSTGEPFTLAGTPSLAVYPSNSTTEITDGITLTVDFDGITGLNHVRVVASTGNGFSVATEYEVVLVAGSVDGVSVVGETVFKFSIENRWAKLNLSNIFRPNGPIAELGIHEGGIPQGVDSSTLTGRSAAADDIVKPGMILWAFGSDQGGWQQTLIISVSGDVFTHNGWPVATPSGSTQSYFVVGAPQQASALRPEVNVKQINDSTVTGDGTSGDKWRGA